MILVQIIRKNVLHTYISESFNTAQTLLTHKAEGNPAQYKKDTLDLLY